MSDPVGVIFGGPSPEHDVSVLTGLQATHSLLDRGYDVVGLYWTKTGEWFRVEPRSETKDFAEGPPDDAEELRLALGRDGGYFSQGLLGRRSALALDVVVNCCHGGPGEDGTLQGALDLAGIRYTGPSQRSAALGMDKAAFAAFCVAQDLPSLPRVTYTGEVDKAPHFDGPYIVKPRYGGSSIGIEVVEGLDDLSAYVQHNVHVRDGAAVEPYRPDSEDLNIAIRSYPELELSAIERPVRGEASERFLSFEDKYTGDEGMAGASREVPADLPEDVSDTITSTAETIGRLLPVRGIARLDFLRDGDELYMNEVNTIPGSLSKYLWLDPERSFHELLDDMVEEARSEATYRPTTEGADGTLLRSERSIAAKLA